MPKMNVAFSLDAEELRRFDDWRSSFQVPLARGTALVELMNRVIDDQLAERPVRNSLASLDPLLKAQVAPVEPFRCADNVVTETKVAEVPTSEKKEDLPLIRSPEDKAAALELLKSKLEKLPDVKGIHEAAKKPDPPGWDDDEYNQGGGE